MFGRRILDDTENDLNAVNVQSYDYVSLCEVEQDYNGQVWLNRLADIGKTGLLQAFYLNEDLPKYFANRSRLFFKDGPSELGAIGVWNWSSIPNNNDFSKDYVTTQFNPDARPIEIIKMQDCKSPNEVLEILKKGFEV